jgi:hypothetical protein
MFPTTKYLGRQQQAEFLIAQGVPCTAQQLADLAYRGRGPKYVIVNGRALSTCEWLLAWIEEQAALPVRRRERKAAQSAAAQRPAA